MNKMPEVYDSIHAFKNQLDAENAVLYCTPKVATWFVGTEYENKLVLGEAVKISKWSDELKIVPVKWQHDEDSRLWDYVEVTTPFYARWSEISPQWIE